MWQVKYKVVRKVIGVLKALTHQLEKTVSDKSR